MGTLLTLYVDSLIDNSSYILKELQTLISYSFEVKTLIYQEDSLPLKPEFLPICIVESDEEELEQILSASNDFECFSEGQYRLRERVIRHNAIYYKREVIPEQLIVFTLRNCPACEKAKTRLDQQGILYLEHGAASRVRRQLRVATAPSFFYENRYLFSDFESFKHTIWADRF